MVKIEGSSFIGLPKINDWRLTYYESLADVMISNN